MFDFFYPFDYNDYLIEKAIQRLNCSISSVIDQDVRVIVCNTSSQCILDRLQYPVTYIHTPRTGRFNKPITINYGVRQCVTSPYFFISDVDLSYPLNYVAQSVQHINDSVPVRVLPGVVGAQSEFYGAYHQLASRDLQTDVGLAHGNGLIHTQSFIDVRGYNEQMFGYGPEDDEFNLRLQFFGNRIIKKPDLKTIHIWHPRGGDVGSTHDTTTFKDNQTIYHDVVNKQQTIVNNDQWGIL